MRPSGALAALGVSSVWDGDALVLKAGVSPDAPAEVDCVESGSTLRFFLPIFAALGVSARFFRPRPPARPPSRRLCGLPAFTRSRAAIFPGWRQPALVPVRPADRRNLPLPGDVSSQFISGLLLALPLCGGGQ